MASPYTSQAISGYNTSPPADDGSQVASNRITWAGDKTKLTDPIKTLAESINTQLISAFAKVIGGGGVTSTAVDYDIQANDQGKLIRGTAASITITTPDAATVTAPFVFGVLNNSSGTITLDGYSTQTIDGNASITLATGSGMIVFTDGSNWYTTGQQGTLTGRQLMYGDIINGTIAETNGSNATTFSLKTLAGTDPSSSDPVLVCFRSVTAASGIYVYRNVTAATTITISSGSTMGATPASTTDAFRLWLVLFDDAGDVRLGAINVAPYGNSLATPNNPPIASSTAEGGGTADSANVFYSTTAVSSKPYVILGFADYASGLTTAGSWNVSPTYLQLYGHGIPRPGFTPAKVRITSASANNSATSLAITYGITNAFRAYEFEVDNLLHATDNQTFLFQVFVGSFQTSNYLCAISEATNSSATAGNASTSGIQMCGTAGLSNTASSGGWSGKITLFNPAGTASVKMVTVQGGHMRTGDSSYSSVNGSGFYKGGAGAVTEVRIISSSGNIVSGKITMYGVTDS